MAEEQSTTDAARVAPPYIAFQSLKTLCATLKEHGVPGRIDRSVLGNFSGAVGGQVMTALKFLHLTDDDNHPSQPLRDLAEAHGTDRWSQTLAGIVREAYKPIFELNLEAASPAQFNEKFHTAYPGKDETLRKSRGFFINAIREAAIPTSSYLMKNKKPRSGPTKRRAKPNGQKPEGEKIGGVAKAKSHSTQEKPGQRQPPPPIPPADARKPSEVLLSHLDPNEMDEEQQSAVWALLKYFKAKGL